ncbi:MAG: hypothetical protein D8M58_15815 [Calditrichaeota bacterium]|nr:MAG: hypothetical protein DWQ03_07545 [Calditrichota bacterium]MBL1206872.1 hypothetical protein [Calditrichota bacterium]NOG46699.1 hypothetical protein [Calditrichota bacterium]
MGSETLVLVTTAASIAFFHTLLGPDHYLPFVMMAKARKWSMLKTTWVTIVCGVGHVLSSVLLGIIGITFAIAVFKLESIESLRGDFAAWLLIIFGLSYFVWGLHKVYRGKAGHSHLFGSHKHHYHEHDHEHAKDDKHAKKETTPWLLFVIFVLGPCEPLIPLLMYPAARNSTMDVVYVTIVFGVVTIATMLSVVMASVWGLTKIKLGALEKYIHPISGFAIFLSGMAIVFLGL